MKICVFGAGAVGGHFAARLHKGGAEVSVVARGAHLAAIRERGLRVFTPDEEIIAPVRASVDPSDLGLQDAVLVTVKAPALPAVAAAIGPLLGPTTPVVFAMNGIPWFYYGPGDQRIERLDPGGALDRAIGLERAVAGVVYTPCTVTAPGEILVEARTSRLVLGMPGGDLSPPVSEIAAILTAGGMNGATTERIRDTIWSKLLLNLGSGLLGVLTGTTPSVFFAEEGCREVTRSVLAEGAAIAAAMGCHVQPDADGQIRNGSASHERVANADEADLVCRELPDRILHLGRLLRPAQQRHYWHIGPNGIGEIVGPRDGCGAHRGVMGWTPGRLGPPWPSPAASVRVVAMLSRPMHLHDAGPAAKRRTRGTDWLFGCR